MCFQHTDILINGQEIPWRLWLELFYTFTRRGTLFSRKYDHIIHPDQNLTQQIIK